MVPNVQQFWTCFLPPRIFSNIANTHNALLQYIPNEIDDCQLGLSCIKHLYEWWYLRHLFRPMMKSCTLELTHMPPSTYQPLKFQMTIKKPSLTPTCHELFHSFLIHKGHRSSVLHIVDTLNMLFSVIYGILCHYGNFLDDFLWIIEQKLSCVMDEFIHRPKPYLLLSATCDEILSWMIEAGWESTW
jgi:hypothetical protein